MDTLFQLENLLPALLSECLPSFYCPVISTLVVILQIRRFIRNWRKVKEIRDRDKVKAAAEARQESYKQINLLEDGEEEFEEPHPQGGSYPIPGFPLLVYHRQGFHSQWPPNKPHVHQIATPGYQSCTLVLHSLPP